MVLLPQPRRVSLSDRLVAASEPAVSVGACGLPPEGYKLRIGPDGAVTIEAPDDAGAAYAAATLTQLARAGSGLVPQGEIEDWPDLPVRAVMLDISRDKVPTMATLLALVDRLAGWKVNQLQLYTEHTFAYTGHEEVWADASPMTADEIRALDAHCRARHIELVPNQNCLGHWERWLRHERYRPLAMAPDGFTDGFGRKRPPTTLEPTNPEALPLVRSLLAELLPNFGSRRVHVGLDEPWELGPARVGDYLDWVKRLCAAPELDGREVLVWGDVLRADAQRLGALPPNVTVCEWGYEDNHPFPAMGAKYAAAGRSWWVSPGTSSWVTILGRWENMIGNIASAVGVALEHGAGGMLNTEWGDQGYLQPLSVSEPGLAFGAAAGWCLDANRDLDLAAALDAHCWHDGAGVLGGVVRDLGGVYRMVKSQFPNISTVVMHLYFPQFPVGAGLTGGCTVEELEGVASALERSEARLGGARPSRPDGASLVEELRWAVALVGLLVRDAIARLRGDGHLRAIPAAERTSLAEELDGLIAEHRRLWLARNRPGGLEDSVAWLAHLRDCYRAGEAAADWWGW